MDSLALLRVTEAITSLRHRESAARLASEALIELLQAQRFTWLRNEDRGGRSRLRRYAFLNDKGRLVTPGQHDAFAELQPATLQAPTVQAAIASGKMAVAQLDVDHLAVALPFITDSGHLDSLLLIDCHQHPSAEQQSAVSAFLQIFSNYLALLDYGERDTLTGLYNRKTFDESLDRLLQRDISGRTRDDRRHDDRQDPFWLAVLDIDLFKQINDNWGHLFGDETLLRFSRLLRYCFREEDQLFRFGGEEFVVIVRASSAESVFRCFQRFHDLLATHPFPRVDTLTCSIGFTRLNASLPAVDILGHADQALYYAKSNGRNQTCHYEELVAEGLIEIKSPEESDADLELDIDRLFDQLSRSSHR